jgi:hypothetical protein
MVNAQKLLRHRWFDEALTLLTRVTGIMLNLEDRHMSVVLGDVTRAWDTILASVSVWPGLENS